MKTKLHELTDRWAALLLVLVIVFWLFAGPLSQKADAVVVSSVIVGAAIATMALAGITFVASGMTAAQLQDWVSEKLNEWAADVGSPLDHLINSAGIGVTISGLLAIGTAAAQGINQFISWLRTNLGLQDNSSENLIHTVGGFKLKYFTDWQNENMDKITNITNNNSGNWWAAAGTSEVYLVYITSNGVIAPISDQPFTIYKKYLPNYSNTPQETTASSYKDGNIYTADMFAVSSQSSLAVQLTTYSTWAVAKAAFGELSQSSNQDLTIQTGVITIPTVNNDDKVFVDVGALPGSTVTEVTDGVISDAATNTLDVSGEVAESEPEYVIDGPEPVYGLADVFPFCIPFDLYDFVSCLAADPVAPHFEWRLYVEDLVDYTFVIDLQQFETVAQIFRTMFLLAFIIGLAMVTRHLLRS